MLSGVSPWNNDGRSLKCASHFRVVPGELFQLPLKRLVGSSLDNVSPRTGLESPESEYRYSSTFSLTSALDVGGWLTPRPGRFIRGKETRYPSYRRLDGPQSRSGRVRKILPSPGLDSRTIQPTVSRCTG